MRIRSKCDCAPCRRTVNDPSDYVSADGSVDVSGAASSGDLGDAGKDAAHVGEAVAAGAATGAAIGGSALASAAAGAALGSALPGIGTVVGGAIGALIGVSQITGTHCDGDPGWCACVATLGVGRAMECTEGLIAKQQAAADAAAAQAAAAARAAQIATAGATLGHLSETTEDVRARELANVHAALGHLAQTNEDAIAARNAALRGSLRLGTLAPAPTSHANARIVRTKPVHVGKTAAVVGGGALALALGLYAVLA